MKKIPTLFLRDLDDMAHVLKDVHPECRWVLAGEGTPTRKYDGTCVMVDEEGHVWSRREVKPGKAMPPRFQVVDSDFITGKVTGWEPAEQSSFVKYIREALGAPKHTMDAEFSPIMAPKFGSVGSIWKPGTYELIGPKINGDPEGLGDAGHLLLEHSTAERESDFAGPWLFVDDPSIDEAAVWAVLRDQMKDYPHEGIVWHHDDGQRMAKLKRKDFDFS